MPQQFVVSFCLVGSQLPAAPCIQCQHGHPAVKICTAAQLIRTQRSLRLMRFTRAGQLAARDIQWVTDYPASEVSWSHVNNESHAHSLHHRIHVNFRISADSSCNLFVACTDISRETTWKVSSTWKLAPIPQAVRSPRRICCLWTTELLRDRRPTGEANGFDRIQSKSTVSTGTKKKRQSDHTLKRWHLHHQKGEILAMFWVWNHVWTLLACTIDARGTGCYSTPQVHQCEFSNEGRSNMWSALASQTDPVPTTVVSYNQEWVWCNMMAKFSEITVLNWRLSWEAQNGGKHLREKLNQRQPGPPPSRASKQHRFDGMFLYLGFLSPSVCITCLFNFALLRSFNQSFLQGATCPSIATHSLKLVQRYRHQKERNGTEKKGRDDWKKGTGK